MTNERLPQRFRYQAIRGNRWIHGIVMVGSMGQWTIHTATGLFSNLVTDPGTEIRDIIGDVDEFQWIDNDYGWAGDVMPKHDPEASAREMILAAVAHVGPIAAHKFVDEWFTLENAQ